MVGFSDGLELLFLGNSDNPNVSRRFREGWQPCRLEDHPELQVHMMDHQSEWATKGNIEIAGLLLCKIPKEVVDERNKHFENIAQQQIEAVDNTFLKTKIVGWLLKKYMNANQNDFW